MLKKGTVCELSLITTTTTITPLTSSGVAFCPPSITICQNGGLCLILNGVDLQCVCSLGYTGKI